MSLQAESPNLQFSHEQISLLLDEAGRGEKYPIARLISLIENPVHSCTYRKIIFQLLQEKGRQDGNSRTVGITGTPGAGKSSLIGELCQLFLTRGSEQSLAVVAIDPTSNISGGSILGDRTRVVLPTRENRVFFRSQASQLEMGGVNPYTYHVIRFLRHLFDFVIIETVGIGQNEIEVTKLADFSFLVMQPLGGDQVQFMKSGIMEVPDAFIINKCDEEKLAKESYYTLSSSLEFLQNTISTQMPPIFLTSVLQKTGIESLLDFIFEIPLSQNRAGETGEQLKKWILAEYGKYGWRRVVHELAVDIQSLQDFESFEEQVRGFIES